MRNSCDKVQVPTQTRKIKPTRRSVSGIYNFRGERAIPFESTLERDFIIRMEFVLSVLEIIPQPVRIPFVAPNGREFEYTPDFLVYYRVDKNPWAANTKPKLVEVKPSAQWKKHWREWRSKWKAARRYAAGEAWEFCIYDESRIRDQAYENIRFLERYKRMIFPEEESQWMIRNLGEMGCAPFHYLLNRHHMGIYRAQGVAHIWHLLATRRLECDITRTLNNNTELWVADQ